MKKQNDIVHIALNFMLTFTFIKQYMSCDTKSLEYFLSFLFVMQVLMLFEGENSIRE